MSLSFLFCYIFKSFKIFIKKNDFVILIQRCHEARDSWIHWRDVTFYRAGLGISDGQGKASLKTSDHFLPPTNSEMRVP